MCIFGSFVGQSVCYLLNCFQLFVTPWTVACQTSLSIEFSKQEYWGGLPFPSPGNLPNPGIEPGSPSLQVDSFTTEPGGKPQGKLCWSDEQL